MGARGRVADLIKNAPNASLYHALEWRDVLRRAFGHRSWYLMAQDDGKTRGSCRWSR